MTRLALALLLTLSPAVAWGQDVPPAPEPVELNQGQPAPSRGVFTTDARATWIASRCAADKQARDDLAKALQAQPSGYTGTALVVTGVVAFVLGAAAVAYLKR